MNVGNMRAVRKVTSSELLTKVKINGKEQLYCIQK